MVAVPWRRFCQAAWWNGQPAHSTTGVASCEREPLPVVELQRRNHRQRQHGHREDGSDDEAEAQRAGRIRDGRPVATPAAGSSAA